MNFFASVAFFLLRTKCHVQNCHEWQDKTDQPTRAKSRRCAGALPTRTGHARTRYWWRPAIEKDYEPRLKRTTR